MAIGFKWGSPTVSSLIATGTGVAGATQLVLEVNRASDFASDDTLFYPSAKQSSVDTFPILAGGLPSGTPWFGRLRNASTGEVSPIDLLSTLPATLVSAYTGYSIDKAMLVVPQDIVALTSAAGALAPGFPLQNMLRDDPASTARYTGSTAYITFATSGAPLDTIALLGTMFNEAATWLVQAFSDEGRQNLVYSSGIMPVRCSPSIGHRRSYHCLLQFVPTTARYWAIGLEAPGASAIILRNLVVGKARASTNADKGAGYGVNDLGSATRTRFGVLDSVRGWRGKVVDFAMSWISETEFQAKWADLPGLVGTTKAVLAIPNSKRNIHLNDRIAFGNITQMRGENVQSFKYSQTIEINSIY